MCSLMTYVDRQITIYNFSWFLLVFDMFPYYIWDRYFIVTPLAGVF